jgi:AmmeMemoRadiSam system protein A
MKEKKTMEKKPLNVLWCLKRYAGFLWCLFLFWVLISSSVADEPQKNIKKDNFSSQEATTGEGKMADSEKLNDKEGKYLLDMARKTIEEALSGKKAADQDGADDSPRFAEKRGTFVTLTIDKNLRGCIGHIIPQETLLEGVKENAINAAFKDPRFNPLSKSEWQKVKIEISILTDPARLEYSDADDLLKKIHPNIDGVIIKKGYYQSTFLPQVWEQLPDKKEFFTHLCLKAGMDGNEWRKGKLEVYTYQVQAFEED